jgi:hypothetical protein
VDGVQLGLDRECFKGLLKPLPVFSDNILHIIEILLSALRKKIGEEKSQRILSISGSYKIAMTDDRRRIMTEITNMDLYYIHLFYTR